MQQPSVFKIVLRNTFGGLLFVFVLATQGAAVAARPTTDQAAKQSGPEEVFKTHGLTRTGFLLITAEEREIHAVALSVHALKSKITFETISRNSISRAIDSATNAFDHLEAQLASLDQKMQAVKGDPTQYNQLVVPFNDTLRQANQRKTQIDELKKKEGMVADSQSLLTDTALAAAQRADAAVAVYAALARDPALKAAIETYDLGAAQPVKLGPSKVFSDDVAFVKKCVSDIAVQGIPIRMENGVPVVEVTINGKTREMIWDSGASAVSLSAETAAEFGLRAADDDPTVVSTVADGRQVKDRLIVVPSIQVGVFTGSNIECLIDPPSSIRGPDLLGGSFQRHFLCRLD